MLLKCAVVRLVPNLFTTSTRAISFVRPTLLQLDKHSNLSLINCVGSKRFSDMAESVEEKMKELKVGSSKQKAPSKPLEVRHC